MKEWCVTLKLPGYINRQKQVMHYSDEATTADDVLWQYRHQNVQSVVEVKDGKRPVYQN